MDLITYALLKKKIESSKSIMKETLSVDEDGQIILTTSLPYIGIDFETGNLETDSEKFSIQNNNLVCEV